ncbi:hypothetical protein [Lentibacillus populi]|nr:hypothetical protein [Lentibacillus populi]
MLCYIALRITIVTLATAMLIIAAIVTVMVVRPTKAVYFKEASS